MKSLRVDYFLFQTINCPFEQQVCCGIWDGILSLMENVFGFNGTTATIQR